MEMTETEKNHLHTHTHTPYPGKIALKLFIMNIFAQCPPASYHRETGQTNYTRSHPYFPGS